MREMAEGIQRRVVMRMRQVMRGFEPALACSLACVSRWSFCEGVSSSLSSGGRLPNVNCMFEWGLGVLGVLGVFGVLVKVVGGSRVVEYGREEGVPMWRLFGTLACSDRDG